MTTYLWGTGFDTGLHVNSADLSGEGLYCDTDIKKTGAASLACHTGTVPGSWVRHTLAVAQPSVSVYIYPLDQYDYTSTDKEAVFPNVMFSLGEVYQIVARWNGYTHTMDLYLRYVPPIGAIVNTLLASGTIEVSQNDFFNFQMWVSTTFIAIKIDGHLSINYAGSAPAGYGYDYCYLWGGRYALVGGYGVRTRFDDWVIGENGWLGSMGVDELLPTADSTVQFTPIGGLTNVEEINEVVANDATYNYAITNGLADKFEIAPFDEYTAEGILKHIVAVEGIARMEIDAATGDSGKVQLVSNSIIVGTTHPLATAYEHYYHIAEVDPNTDLPWTPDAVRAVLLRYEAVIA